MATVAKPKQPKANSLQEFYAKISDNHLTRAREMNKICAESDVSYQHLKGVMNRKRSLSIDAAERFQAAALKRGGKIDLADLVISQANRR